MYFFISFIDFIYAGEDSCNGDSGGPLMSFDGGFDDYQKPKFLRGIVSFGSQNCGNVRPLTIYIPVKKIVYKGCKCFVNFTFRENPEFIPMFKNIFPGSRNT